MDLFGHDGFFRLNSNGVEADVPIASAVVLFGRNDCGKTNTLRSITSLVTGEMPQPRDRFRVPLEQREGEQLRIWLDPTLAVDQRLLAQVAGLWPAGRFRYSPPSDDGSCWIGLVVADDQGLDEDEDSDDLRYDSLYDSLREAVHAAVEAAGPHAELDPAEVVDRLLRRPYLWFHRSAVELGLDESWADFAHVGEFETYVPRFASLRVRDAPVTERPKNLADLVLLTSSSALEQETGAILDDIQQQIFSLSGWRVADELDEFQHEAYYLEDDMLMPDGRDAYTRHDPWFFEGTGEVSDEIIDACAGLSDLATKHSPSFIQDEYSIEVQPLVPSLWFMNRGRRVRVALVPVDPELRPDGGDGFPPGFDVDAVGAGLRIWTLFSLYEALRQSRSFKSWAEALFVFDEPERHLHPVAQRQAAQFIKSIVKGGANVIVATHAPAFLNESIPSAQYVRLSRVGGITRATPLEFSTIERHLADLGLTRADLIQLTRGALLVEGTQDKQVFYEFFSEQLADAHVRVFALDGTHNARALLDAELLRQLGIPLFLMFDQTRRTFTDGLNHGLNPKPSSDEERKLAPLAQDLRRRSFRVTYIPQPHPDIVWTLPEEAVTELAPGFPGWTEATTEFRASARGNPKTFLEMNYGLKVTPATLSRLVAISKKRGLEPGRELKAALATILAGC